MAALRVRRPVDLAWRMPLLPTSIIRIFGRKTETKEFTT
jgi:hypothetical protein